MLGELGFKPRRVAKSTVPIGNLSRGDKIPSRHQALDYDLEPDTKLTPFCIHRLETAGTGLCFTTGSLMADIMVDLLSEIWPSLKKPSFSEYPPDLFRQ